MHPTEFKMIAILKTITFLDAYNVYFPPCIIQYMYLCLVLYSLIYYLTSFILNGFKISSFYSPKMKNKYATNFSLSLSLSSYSSLIFSGKLNSSKGQKSPSYRYQLAKTPSPTSTWQNTIMRHLNGMPLSWRNGSRSTCIIIISTRK